MLYAGLPYETLGIVSASKLCRVVVALKTLAPTQQIMMIDIAGAKAAVLEHSCFLVCILTSQSSLVEKHELIFDALQIAHLFELFYREEIELIVHRERAVLSAAADSYSVNTEINFLERSDESNLPFARNFFVDFSSKFVDKLLLREPLCSEWILPLISADDIVGCSLINSDGDEILKLPALCGPHVVLFRHSDLHSCCATIQLVVEQAIEMMVKLMKETETESKGSTAVASLDSSRLEGQLRIQKTVNLGGHGPNSYNALMLPISNGPMGKSLCLVVYYWYSTAKSKIDSLIAQVPHSPLTSCTSQVTRVQSLPRNQASDDRSLPYNPCSSHVARNSGCGSDFQKWNGPPAGRNYSIYHSF